MNIMKVNDTLINLDNVTTLCIKDMTTQDKFQFMLCVQYVGDQKDRHINIEVKIQTDKEYKMVRDYVDTKFAEDLINCDLINLNKKMTGAALKASMVIL